MLSFRTYGKGEKEKKWEEEGWIGGTWSLPPSLLSPPTPPEQNTHTTKHPPRRRHAFSRKSTSTAAAAAAQRKRRNGSIFTLLLFGKREEEEEKMVPNCPGRGMRRGKEKGMFSVLPLLPAIHKRRLISKNGAEFANFPNAQQFLNTLPIIQIQIYLISNLFIIFWGGNVGECIFSHE